MKKCAKDYGAAKYCCMAKVWPEYGTQLCLDAWQDVQKQTSKFFVLKSKVLPRNIALQWCGIGHKAGQAVATIHGDMKEPSWFFRVVIVANVGFKACNGQLKMSCALSQEMVP
eukprot:1578422-Amphidinium_carterae.1